MAGCSSGYTSGMDRPSNVQMVAKLTNGLTAWQQLSSIGFVSTSPIPLSGFGTVLGLSTLHVLI